MDFFHLLILAVCIFTAKSVGGAPLDADVDLLIERLVLQDYESRLNSAKYFEQTRNKNLRRYFTEEEVGITEHIARYLISTRGEIYADLIKDAMSDFIGVDQKNLVTFLTILNKKEKKETLDAYKKKYGETLQFRIEDSTSGLFEKLLLGLLENNRNAREQIHRGQLENIAVDLYSAGEGRLGTDDGFFVRVFTDKNFNILKSLFQIYKEKYGKPMEVVISDEFSGDDYIGFLQIVKLVQNKIDVLAQIMHESLQSWGPHAKRRVYGILISRSGIDMGEIKKVYDSKYGSLEKDLTKLFDGKGLELLQSFIENQVVTPDES